MSAQSVQAPVARQALDYPPLRTRADIEALERVPLEQRISSWDFAQCLLDGCRRDGAKTGIHFVANGDSTAPAQTWRYAEIEQHGIRIANLLHAQGLRNPDAIAVVTPTLPALYTSMLGAFLAGLPFPVNWMLDAAALRTLFARAQVKAVIALGPTPGFSVWETVQAAAGGLTQAIPVFSLSGPGGSVLPETDLHACAAAYPGDRLTFPRAPVLPDTVAAYVPSGGTTGAPKIVRLTHRGLVYRHWATNLGLALTPDDVVLADTPMFHIGGLCVRGLIPLANGMGIVIPSVFGARDKTYLAHYWKFVERFGVTQLSGVPTTLSVLARQPPAGENVTSLRPYFSTGSTALAPAVQERIAAISGARPLMMYGLTENTSNVTIDPRDGEVKIGCSGLRVPYTQVRVVELDAAGVVQRDCAPGETGMMLIVGPGIAAGYLDAQHDAGAFRADGWFVTGDLGSVDAEGYVRITGRRKDLIIRGGHNIDPGQIEAALMQAPAVALAAAVGKPDTHAGELPVAYVELRAGMTASAAELLAFITPLIAERAAIPKEIVLIERIPLSAVGKPLKHLLAADAARRAFAAALRELPGRHALEVRQQAGGLALAVQLFDADAAVRDAAERILAHYTMPFTITLMTNMTPALAAAASAASAVSGAPAEPAAPAASTVPTASPALAAPAIEAAA